MTKERKDNQFIKKPFYPGGNKAFKDFILKQLQYPQEAIDNKIEGTVVVKYDVDYKGNVIEANILKSIGHGCDEEAVRIIKLLKFEIPKGPRKLRVLFHKQTKIHFRIPIKKQPKETVENSVKLSSQIKAAPILKDKKIVAKKSYTYTITW